MTKKTETESQMRKRLRAGKIKCRRCKQVFVRAKGEQYQTCERCRTHCNRCDVLLTEKNMYNKKTLRSGFRCKTCHANSSFMSDPERAREYGLMTRYGITVPEYEAILRSQGGVCYICTKPPKSIRLHVDHKHVPKDKQTSPQSRRLRVRGLLCWPCNAAIGKFRDDSKRLSRAADYVDTWPAQAVLKLTRERGES